jgi:hypothetical protein
VDGRIGVLATAQGPLSHPELLDAKAVVRIDTLAVKHPWLKSLPARLGGGSIQVLKDDVVIDCAGFRVTFGANTFPFPLCGSVRTLAGVDNLFKADPHKIGPVLLEKMGGLKKLLNQLGEEQLLRITGDKLYKIKINIRVTDREQDFVFQTAITPEETLAFRENTQRIVDKYIILAKQALAEQLGFKKRIYGEQNYKMMQIAKAKAIVLDRSFNMVYPKEIPFWRLLETPSEW